LNASAAIQPGDPNQQGQSSATPCSHPARPGLPQSRVFVLV
jgi:hypothetical protein